MYRASLGNSGRDNCTKSENACFIPRQAFQCENEDTKARYIISVSPVTDHSIVFIYLILNLPLLHIGSDAVDWMMSNLPIKSRREGVELGKRLMAANYFTFIDAEGAQPFKDRKIFFCLRV